MPRNREEVKALGRRTVYSKTYNPGVLETSIRTTTIG